MCAMLVFSPTVFMMFCSIWKVYVIIDGVHDIFFSFGRQTRYPTPNVVL